MYPNTMSKLPSEFATQPANSGAMLWPLAYWSCPLVDGTATSATEKMTASARASHAFRRQVLMAISPITKHTNVPTKYVEADPGRPEFEGRAKQNRLYS